MNARRILLVLAGTLATVLAATALAGAATVDEPGQRSSPAGADVLTSPPRIIGSVPPGESTRATLTVVNRAGSTRTFTVSRFDLAPDPEGRTYAALVEPGTAPIGAGDWISVDRPSFRLGPDERTVLDVRIDVPSTATGGGHYGAIVVETGTQDEQAGGVNIRVRAVTHVVVNVPGATAYRVDLDDLEVDAADGRLQVRVELQNIGNIHSSPTVRLRTTGPFGRERTTVVEVPETLPGGRRELETTIGLPFPAGRFDVTASARLETDEDGGASARVGPESTWATSREVQRALYVLAALLVVLVPVVWWRRRRELQRYLREELDRYEDDLDDA